MGISNVKCLCKATQPSICYVTVAPLIVRRLMTLLSNDMVSDNWILQAVYNLKEEWMQ